jgi:hypothetical protein
MNTSKEHAEELARFLNEGITDRESEFFDAQAAVVRGKASTVQQELVEEWLKNEPWRRRIFEEVKAHAESETPESRRAEKERIFEHIGLDLPAIEATIEREKHGNQPNTVVSPLEHVAGQVEAAIGRWIQLAADLCAVKLDLTNLRLLPAYEGAPPEEIEVVVLGENVEGIVDDEVTFAWSAAEGFPTAGVAILSIGGNEFTSKIVPDGFGGGSASFDKETITECAKAPASVAGGSSNQAILTIKSEAE